MIQPSNTQFNKQPEQEAGLCRRTRLGELLALETWGDKIPLRFGCKGQSVPEGLRPAPLSLWYTYKHANIHSDTPLLCSNADIWDHCLSLSYSQSLSSSEHPCAVGTHAFFMNTHWSSFERPRSIVAIRGLFLCLWYVVEGRKLHWPPIKATEDEYSQQTENPLKWGRLIKVTVTKNK